MQQSIMDFFVLKIKIWDNDYRLLIIMTEDSKKMRA